MSPKDSHASHKNEPDNHEANSLVQRAVRQILSNIGEDANRSGLRRTPERVAAMYNELTRGYQVDPIAMVNDAIFEISYDEMVLVCEIDFYSLCEHHLLPFFGKAHVAYLPRGRVIGLSKIPRIVEMYARRLQVQERMTVQIADFLQEVLDPQGVGVVVEATHMCMAMRGVEKPNSRMITTALKGRFKSDPRTRSEFLAHIDRQRS
ncbi:MAG: GTP cyclohydrolase I FolE [Chloroflexi bacterium]|nr:GTP cyclohydrolase I FolE [Chloroflexota bacterium]